MSLLAIVLALLIEQVRPLQRGNPLHAAMRGWVRWVTRSFDAGHRHNAWVAWTLAVALPALLALGVHWLLAEQWGWPFAVVWNVAVLYTALGFRQFSFHFTDIRDALDAGDDDLARQLLAEWQQVDAAQVPRGETVRHVLEYSVLAAHRHVFGVLAWYSVLAAFGFGPAGAVLYRLGEFVPRYWKFKEKLHDLPVSSASQQVAASAWYLIDWLPARITSLGFAVVGSFEDAIEAWRSFAGRAGADNDGLILAATAGAVNVRMGPAFSPDGQGPGASGDMADRPAAPIGQVPEAAHLRTIVGLVWRSVVMWIILLALLTLARLLG